MLLLGGEQSPWLSSVWRNGRSEWWRVGCITRMKERCEWRVISSGLVISHATYGSYTFTRPYDHKFQYSGSAYTAQYTSLYSRPHGCRGGTNTSPLVTFVTHNPHHRVYHHHHHHHHQQQQHRIRPEQTTPQVCQHKKVLSHLASLSALHRQPVNSAKMRSSTVASPSPSSAPS